jgi:hypothetical protein
MLHQAEGVICQSKKEKAGPQGRTVAQKAGEQKAGEHKAGGSNHKHSSVTRLAEIHITATDLNESMIT